MRISSELRKVLHLAGDAIARYRMIAAGDHVAVALSGGKDSTVLLHVLSVLRKRSPVPWTLSAIAVDPGGGDFPAEEVESIAHAYGLACTVERTAIFEDVARTDRRKKGFCSLCSRFRRGALLRVAEGIGATKIALGHHQGDIIETLLMNIVFSGRFMTMAPVLPSRGGRIAIVRPFIAVHERLIAEVAERLPFRRATCERGRDTRRAWARRLLAELEAANPRARVSLMRALENVVPSHLLAPPEG